MDLSRRVNAYRFSYCLYAYIYKKYHLKTELPVKVDYENPKIRIFSKEVGEAVSEISEIFREFLVPVFSQIVPRIRLSAACFFEYVKWYFEHILDSFSDEHYRDYLKKFVGFAAHSDMHLKFLSLCAFIANLVTHSFAEGCYYFTPSAPTCLAELLVRKPEIYDEFNELCEAFCDLNHFCDTSLFAVGFDLINMKQLLKSQAEYLNDNFSPSNFNCFSNEYIFNLTEDVISSPPHPINSRTSIEKINIVEENSMMELQKFKVCKEVSGSKTCRSSDESDCETLTNEWFDSLEYNLETDYSNGEGYEVSEYINDDKTNFNRGVTCSFCKAICLESLEEFIEDFKATHYEDETE